MAKPPENASSSSRSYEFFKVYLPQFSSHKLVIPPAFISIFSGSFPNKATLKNHAGKLWRVSIEENAKLGVLFTKGWQDFADHHSLEFGDFLIFNYDGNSVFSVSIFGKNGCKKYSGIPADRSSFPVKEEPELEPDETEPNRRNNVAREFRKSEDSRRGDPPGIEWVAMKKCKAEPSEFSESTYVLPKNPHYVRRITPSNRYTMAIPRSILQLNGIKLQRDVELRDQNGKKWPVKVTFLKKSVYMASGWHIFRREHELRINNKCLFEFIVGKSNICREIYVQIIRGDVQTQTKNRCQVMIS